MITLQFHVLNKIETSMESNEEVVSQSTLTIVGFLKDGFQLIQGKIDNLEHINSMNARLLLLIAIISRDLCRTLFEICICNK